MKPVAFIIFCVLSLIMNSCKKETFITSSDAKITVSADTLRFDTLFTSVGSVTQSFKIKNNNNQKLKFSHIRLKGGIASPFKMNVDGTGGPESENITVEANDSIYVFVSVSLGSTSADLPFIVKDSIEIGYNGNTRLVQLESWGQNANFLRARKISGKVTWTNNLPYVILGGLQVDTNATLIIEKGCRIYLHADAPFIVDGSLQVNGERFDSTRVYFRSDRLDDPYKDYPAGWPGIYFRGSSKDNVLRYAVIQNAYQGVVIEQKSLNGNPKLVMNQCIVDNIYDVGLLAVQSSVQASNCLISNCGKNVQLVYGGDYQFDHCTLASFSSNYLLHKEPVLFISNYVKQDNSYLTTPITSTFRNCIFWGDNGVIDEVVTTKQGNDPFSLRFENCLVKVKTLPADITSLNLIFNQEPVFDSINNQKRYYNFRLKENSPALNKGVNTVLSMDLDGLNRPVGIPDIGAYERQ